MKIYEIISSLEAIAPRLLQESYDNAGLLTGDVNCECTGVMVALDAVESVLQEAVENQCNLVIAHHPIIFGGLKKITGKNYVERTVIYAIKNDIAIYAIHTNLDNIIQGVSGKMADMLGLIDRQVLQPKSSLLKKLIVYVPVDHAENLRNALFNADAGSIGNYSECSFSSNGEGTYKAGENTNPFAGKKGERHTEKEVKVEVIYETWKEQRILNAMIQAHPYEEAAHDIFPMNNYYKNVGSGIFGRLGNPLPEKAFLSFVKDTFHTGVIKHTKLTGRTVEKVALCGGAGSFLVKAAIGSGADFYITADMKYHEFFDAEEKMVIADIGHFESEQFTIDLLIDILKQKYPTFAVLKTKINTNPVSYFI